MFSRTFGYAVRATVYVALHTREHGRVGVLELSDKLDIPRHFLGKIMQDLVRHGILESAKGPAGGFFMNARTLDVCLLDILNITDGNQIQDNCALGIRRCNSDHPCSLHHEFAACRNGLYKVMSLKTISELAKNVDLGVTFLSHG